MDAAPRRGSATESGDGRRVTQVAMWRLRARGTSTIKASGEDTMLGIASSLGMCHSRNSILASPMWDPHFTGTACSSHGVRHGVLHSQLPPYRRSRSQQWHPGTATGAQESPTVSGPHSPVPSDRGTGVEQLCRGSVLLLPPSPGHGSRPGPRPGPT